MTPTTKQYSRLVLQMDKEIAKHEAKLAILPAEAFTDAENMPEAKAERIRIAKSDFFKFDDIYFPASVHPQGHSMPGSFHRAIAAAGVAGGIRWILAHRDHAKTVYGLKFMLWLMLRGDIAISGLYSELIDKAKNLLSTLTKVLEENPRINGDFEVKFEEKDQEKIRFRCSTNKRACTILCFSPGRSVKGSSVDMGRIEFLLGDDVETLNSSMDKEAVEMRIRKLVEAYKSCTKNATFLIFGNNFDEDCAANTLKKEQEEGTARKFITVHPFNAWIEEPFTVFGIRFKRGPLWPECYFAKNEEELRELLRIVDDAEWSEAQNDPQKSGDFTFPKAYYQEYDELPDDAMGVTWCDPNLSLKGKGDTTAMHQLLYSPSTTFFYVRKIRCKSYSNSDNLLKDYFSLFEISRIYVQGFDGNVSQESTWTNFLRSFCQLHKLVYVGFAFKKYTVDNYATAAQIPYVNRRVFFEKGTAKSKEGKAYLRQFHRFKGKKKPGKDDAPDAFIASMILMLELALAEGVRLPNVIKVYSEPFSF